MNALLIAGIIVLGIWLERRVNGRRRLHRPTDDALSHALIGKRPR